MRRKFYDKLAAAPIHELQTQVDMLQHQHSGLFVESALRQTKENKGRVPYQDFLDRVRMSTSEGRRGFASETGVIAFALLSLPYGKRSGNPVREPDTGSVLDMTYQNLLVYRNQRIKGAAGVLALVHTIDYGTADGPSMLYEGGPDEAVLFETGHVVYARVLEEGTEINPISADETDVLKNLSLDFVGEEFSELAATNLPVNRVASTVSAARVLGGAISERIKEQRGR